MSENKIKNRWIFGKVTTFYKQERGCLAHFVRLANTLLKDEDSARGNHVLVCNVVKYLQTGPPGLCPQTTLSTPLLYLPRKFPELAPTTDIERPQFWRLRFTDQCMKRPDHQRFITVDFRSDQYDSMCAPIHVTRHSMHGRRHLILVLTNTWWMYIHTQQVLRILILFTNIYLNAMYSWMNSRLTLRLI